MIDWPVALNLVATALVSGALTTLGAWTTNQAGGWTSPLVAGGITALTVLSAHLRSSPTGK